MSLDWGREVCGRLGTVEAREWLVTNGIGGFASGTVSGLLSRRYHGLLVAALKPPLGRTLLVAKLDETLEYGGGAYPLFPIRWADGSVDPRGYREMERFRLEGTTPVWTFAVADALLEKRVFDGDPPFHPRGCIAQAWSVSETLRAWLETTGAAARAIPS